MILPDDLESVARSKIKVNGTAKGARRELNFTSSDSTVTIAGTDDSVNEKMTLDMIVAAVGQAQLAAGYRLTYSGTSAPSSPSEGDHWYDTTNDILNIYTGTVWVTVTPKAALVATAQTTTNVAYVDLATSGPAVTILTNTKALVTVACAMNDTSNADVNMYMSYAVSGATTIAASDTTAMRAVSPVVSNSVRFSRQSYLTTLTAGSNTFTAKYRVLGGDTAEYSDRSISVIALP